MADTHHIPRGLDRPVPILLWEPTEVIMFVILIGVGIIMKMIVVSVIGAIGMMAYSRFKRRGKRGQGVHMLWRHGIILDSLLTKRLPHPTRLDMYR